DLMHTASLAIPSGVPCSKCGVLIPTSAARSADRPGALCLGCLRQIPNAPEGQRLLAYRLAAGLSRSDAAWLACLTEHSAWRAERDLGDVSREAIARLARVLGVRGALSLCEIRLSPRIWGSLWALLDLVGCGPRGLTAAHLARRSGIPPAK